MASVRALRVSPLFESLFYKPARKTEQLSRQDNGALTFMEIDSQTEFPQGLPIPSPCVQICRLNAEQVCIGCGRSVREVAEWASMSREEKIAALDSSRQRLKALQR